MAELVHEHTARVTVGDRAYTVRTCAQARDDGTWEGWLEFHPVAGGKALCTERETTQPSRDAVAYWATGLTPIYIEGALARATAAH